MKIPVYYHPKYNVDLGVHVFPSIKYREIKSKLENSEINKFLEWIEPEKIPIPILKKVHNSSYVDDILKGRRTMATANSELPMREDITEGFLYALGGTLEACKSSLKYKRAVNLGGGFHHASENRAEGFCLFNDVAVSASYLKKKKLADRILIIDLDVHQGNGSALILKKRSGIFTFSMHQENNYPTKEKSSLDIGLEDNCNDDEYLKTLEEALNLIEKKFKADFVLYVAGADIFEDDKLGGLKVSVEGIRKRDKMVMDFVNTKNLPLTMVTAGGYAYNTEDTIQIHLNSIRELVMSMEN